MGRPAASPEVHVAGRRPLVLISNFAPFEASQLVPTFFVSHVSQSPPVPG